MPETNKDCQEAIPLLDLLPSIAAASQRRTKPTGANPPSFPPQMTRDVPLSCDFATRRQYMAALLRKAMDVINNDDNGESDDDETAPTSDNQEL